MANRFWVGGTGTWDNSTTHWSTSSGGATGASIPTSADNVFFDANSGSGFTVTMALNLVCLDLNFTGAVNPTLINGGLQGTIYGSLTLISAMTWNFTGSLILNSTSTGKTITTAGNNMLNTVSAFGVGGGWTLQDNYTGAGILVQIGALNTNGKTVVLSGAFGTNSTSTKSLIMDGSNVTCATFTNITTGTTFSANNSTINVTGTGTFAGGGFTYGNVNLNGSPITITGNNTYTTFSATSAVLNFTAGSNQSSRSFIFNGTPTNGITLQSTVSGSPYTLTDVSGAVIFRHCSIKDCTATGGATFSAIESSTNVSGNTGITFGVARTFMQIKPNGTYESLWFEDSSGVMRNLSAAPFDGTNVQVLINGGFTVNQMSVSGTVTLSAGVYGHDMWKAGASGCTYTFATSLNVTTITITAGSLIQIVEGINLFSGSYTLSWTGTAQGKIGAGSFGASGIVGTAVGGTNLNVEFNIGTLSKVQLNLGSIAYPFQSRSNSQEYTDCIRHYYRSWNDGIVSPSSGSIAGFSYVNNAIFGTFRFPVLMRATPTLVVINNNVINQVRNSSTGSPVSITAPAGLGLNSKGFNGIVPSGTPFTVGQAYDYDITADARL